MRFRRRLLALDAGAREAEVERSVEVDVRREESVMEGRGEAIVDMLPDYQ